MDRHTRFPEWIRKGLEQKAAGEQNAEDDEDRDDDDLNKSHDSSSEEKSFRNAAILRLCPKPVNAFDCKEL
jgi:hypothetical protein